MYGEQKASGKIASVRDVLTKLFDYYASVHSPNVEVESVSEKSIMTTDVDICETNPYAFMDSQYDLHLEAEQSMGCNNELDKYLVENCEGRKYVNFDVLLWWKTNSSRYQVLSKWLGMFWRYLFLQLLLSQHLVQEGVYLIHFEVRSEERRVGKECRP